MKAMIFDIQRNSYVDGPGIRTTVFFKGCNMKCFWCHNPESHDFKPQMMFYKEKCKGCGKCKEVCPYHLEKCDFCGRCELYCPAGARKVCGRKYTIDEVFAEVIKDKDYYDNSGGGATLSGGECLCQADFCVELLKKLKENGVHTAVDTAGNVPRESIDKVIPYTDIFLYDIKAIDEDLHTKGTGQSNKLILENLKYLDALSVPVEIRIPFIPGFNDDQIKKIASFLQPLKNIKSIKVLPYHDMARSKYAALDMLDTLPKLQPEKGIIKEAEKTLYEILGFLS